MSDLSVHQINQDVENNTQYNLCCHFLHRSGNLSIVIPRSQMGEIVFYFVTRIRDYPSHEIPNRYTDDPLSSIVHLIVLGTQIPILSDIIQA